MDVSYQLYSSRNWPLADTLRMLARTGYTQVEGYDGLFQDAQQVAALLALLEETGLKMPTAHFGIDWIENRPDTVIALARDLSLQKVFCPYLETEDRPKDALGWQEFGTRLQSAGAPLRAAGLGFGWHNHDFEFAPLADGTRPLDALLSDGPDLEWEADLAWIARGGGDPLAAVQQYASRLTSVHVKDIAPAGENADEDGWADVGHGTMEWSRLFAALRQTGAAHFIVEHDNPSDHARFAQNAITAIQTF